MSMSLADMADLITDELGLYDATSVSLAKRFLDKEYKTLWDRYAWGDTNGYGSQQVATGHGFVNYPDGMDRIISVRASTGGTTDPPAAPPDATALVLPGVTDVPEPLDPQFPVLNSYLLDPVDSEFLFESEPTIFEAAGHVRYYEEIGNADQRKIRIYPATGRGTTLFFWGKMICPGLVADTDTVGIRNIEPAVIAYAYFDMLQRQRQYAKADLKRKEAQELEQVAWNLEQQQANRPRKTKATTVAGNSLAEMTDAVCQICGQWTPEYRQIIAEFLRRNYQTLYDLYLWPESLVMVRVPYTTEQVVMPEYIDKVLGVRGTNNARMFPADAGLILDITPSAFDDIGTPISYTTLTPVGVSTLPDALTALVLASTSPVDTSPVMLRGEQIGTGMVLEEQVRLNGTTPVTSSLAYDIPITVAKEITIGWVTCNAANDYLLLEQLPPYVREQKHQRLWFLPNPDSSTLGPGETFTCLVLGKRTIKPLLTDQDTPIITGIQQVLIAASAGDIFRKLEKPDLATVFQQRASASTEALKAKNMDQAASAPRFVPQVEPHSYIAYGVGGTLW